MKLIPFGNLHLGIDEFFCSIGKALSGVSSIPQDLSNLSQINLFFFKGLKGAISVGGIGSGDMNGMRQPACIYGYMPFDSGHLLSSIVAFFLRRIGVPHTLCINDQKAR